MPSANAKNAEALSAQQQAELDGREGAKPLSEEANDAITRRVPPIFRPEDNLVPVQPPSKFSADELQPNLTEQKLHDREAELQPDEAPDIEAGEAPAIHPARLAPDAERVKAAQSRQPAAGPGTWPIPEDQLPAAMPSDPPVEDRLEAGSKTFAAQSGVKVISKTGEIEVKSTRAGTTLRVPKKQVAHAAAIWMRLRQQFPQFTQEQLQDQFYLELEQHLGILSTHGQVAAGDERVDVSHPGAEAQNASPTLPENLAKTEA